MSKKTRSKRSAGTEQAAPPPRRSRTPLFALAVLVLVGAAAAVLLWQSAREPAVDTSSGPGRPQLLVDQDRIDFGAVPVNQMVKASFTLTNAGQQPLTLSVPPVAEVLEGCWPPRIVVGSTTLRPGQQTELSMQFTMPAGMDGPHDFRVVVKSNDPEKPQHELRVLSDWIQ